MFDLKNRDSFDNLTLWINFLRDDCSLQKTVCIYGNYTKTSGSVLTTKADIEDMIEKQKINAKYFEVGGKTKEEVINLTDTLIKLYEEERKEGNDGGKDGSKPCYIF